MTTQPQSPRAQFEALLSTARQHAQYMRTCDRWDFEAYERAFDDALRQIGNFIFYADEATQQAIAAALSTNTTPAPTVDRVLWLLRTITANEDKGTPLNDEMLHMDHDTTHRMVMEGLIYYTSANDGDYIEFHITPAGRARLVQSVTPG